MFYFIYTTKERDVGRGSGVVLSFWKRLIFKNHVLTWDGVLWGVGVWLK